MTRGKKDSPLMKRFQDTNFLTFLKLRLSTGKETNGSRSPPGFMPVYHSTPRHQVALLKELQPYGIPIHSAKKSQAYITTIIPSSTGPGLLSAREKPLLENPSSGKNKHTCVKSDSAR